MKRVSNWRLYRQIQRRHLFTGLLITLAAIILINRLYDLQVLEGRAYAEKASNTLVRTLSIPSPRGRILDRDGQVLAESRSGYNLSLLSQEVSKKELNETLDRVCQILQQNGDELAVDIPLRVNSNGDLQWWSSSTAEFFTKRLGSLPERPEDALAALSITEGAPSGLTLEELFVYLHMACVMDSGESALIATSLDTALYSSLAPIAEAYPELVTVSFDDPDRPSSLHVTLSAWDAAPALRLSKVLPGEKLVPSSLFPLRWTGSPIFYDTKAVRFLQQMNLGENLTAAKTYEILRERYDIPGEPERALPVLAVRVNLTLLGYQQYKPLVLARDISAATLAQAGENADKLPGVVIDPIYVRTYPGGSTLAHVLGSMGLITSQQAEQYEELGYDISTDKVGRTGLEFAFEKTLRGRNGKRMVEVDRLGRLTRVVSEETGAPGEDLTLTIDLDLQQDTENALQYALETAQAEGHENARVGGAVAVSVKSGEVLALASYPDYDPNLFSQGALSQEAWELLSPFYPSPADPTKENQDPTLPRPLVNNALTAAFPPGSIFKMVTGAAALEGGFISPTDTVTDYGRYTRYSNTHAPACWLWNSSRRTHGAENIISALRDSCNYYFFEVGDRMGVNPIETMARRFGFGSATGIVLPEAAGTVAGEAFTKDLLEAYALNHLTSYQKTMGLNGDKNATREAAASVVNSPSRETVFAAYDALGLPKDLSRANQLISHIRQNGWTPSKTLSAAIGQSDNTVTVLQAALYSASLASGEKVTPTLIQGENAAFQSLGLSEETLNVLREGMAAVTSTSYQGQAGTAYTPFLGFPLAVSGKTGTAEATDKENYGWFIAYAPADDPEIAVAVCTAQSGEASYAAKAARAMIASYLLGDPAL